MNRYILNMEQRLMIAVHYKNNWCQNFMHTLAIAHLRIDTSIAKKNVYHDFLYSWFAKEFNARKCTHNILSNDCHQFFIAEMLIPYGFIGLWQWIIFGSHSWVDVECLNQFDISKKKQNILGKSDLFPWNRCVVSRQWLDCTPATIASTLCWPRLWSSIQYAQ